MLLLESSYAKAELLNPLWNVNKLICTLYLKTEGKDKNLDLSDEIRNLVYQ